MRTAAEPSAREFGRRHVRFHQFVQLSERQLHQFDPRAIRCGGSVTTVLDACLGDSASARTPVRLDAGGRFYYNNLYVVRSDPLFVQLVRGRRLGEVSRLVEGVNMGDYRRMWNIGGTAHAWCLVCAVGVAGLVCHNADAAVIGTSAVASVTVQEMIDGFPGSVTTDSAETVPDLSNLPLLATGSLTSTDLFGELVSSGQAYAEFQDPGRLDQPNPEEIGLEVASYANGEGVAYSVNSDVEELRTVIFTTPGSPVAEPEIDFNLLGQQTVESRVFVSGAIIFWSTDPIADLTDMFGEVEVRVARQDTGATLFTTSLTVAGDAMAGVVPSSTGAIQFEVVDLADLAAEGVDEESLAILEQVQNTGSLIVVIIPEQQHAYTYSVTADESLVLSAVFAARVSNKPGGTGVAVTLGRPFANLSAFVDQALPGVDGASLQTSVNAVTASRTIGLVRSAGSSRPFACGLFGGEAVALIGVMLFSGFARVRRD